MWSVKEGLKKGLQHVDQCIARRTGHERLNAFISSAPVAQLKDALKDGAKRPWLQTWSMFNISDNGPSH